jgi:ketosteroid isomerase-like protein
MAGLEHHCELQLAPRAGPVSAHPASFRAILRDVSQENVDKTREFIDAYNRRDFDAAMRDFDPDVQWVLPAQQRSDSCVGPEQVRRFWENLDDLFEELRLDPQELVDAGDRVAVRLRFFGRGKGSGAELDTEMYHQVTTFRDGTMIRIEYVTSWAEALEAAGVAE